MINKDIYFIWFGENNLNFQKYIDNFRVLNPLFNIHYICENDLNDIKSIEYKKDIINCIEYIQKYSKYRDIIDNGKMLNLNFITLLSDVLRLELLNKYGGIYLDIDTFPNKPFDETLLSLDSFCAYSYMPHSRENRKKDCFFLGKQKDNNIILNWKNINNIVPVQDDNYRKELFYKNKKFFMNCEFQNIKTYNSNYIEHFEFRSWYIK